MELMFVVALIAIITPVMTMFFLKVSQGMAADEMHLQLQTLNEQTLLRLHERCVASRHMFQSDTSGISFLGPVTQAMSASTKSNYPILQGTQLALTQPITGTGSFSPVTAVAANFGNSVLMGVYDSNQTIGIYVYPAPATVATNANVTVLNKDGVSVNEYIDLYRIYYYYLTPANPKTLRNTPAYRLVEWQSTQYADYNELYDLSLVDFTLFTNVIKWLTTKGDVAPQDTNYAINFAWDPTQQDPNQAFFTLSTVNGAVLVNPMTTLSEGPVTALTRVSSGILSTGFFYGISPNSAGWNRAPATVPQFAIANGNFPGGFEVGISGTSAGMEVMLRSLLVAQGATPQIVWNDQTIVNSVRDTW